MWFFSVASVWTVQGLYLDSYWTIGGALTVIGVTTLIFPLLYECPINKIYAFIGGSAIGLLPATAYTFSLLSFIFFVVVVYISFFKYKYYRKFFLFSVLGGCFANIIIVSWLLIYGDIKGMVIYHFIVNQLYYINYVPFDSIVFIHSLIPSLTSDHLIENLAIYTFSIGSLLLLNTAKYRANAFIVIIGILTLQLRGSIGFQNGTFLLASFGMFLLSFVMKVGKKPLVLVFFIIVIFVIMAIHSRYAISSPFGMTLLQRKNIHWELFREKSEMKFVQEIQKYTNSNQRILVIPYNPDIYIYANRLPINKYHAYLPWEADYAQHPWSGYERDICIDLPKEKPAVIFFDNFIVWGKYSADKYMPCVLELINKEYTRMPNGSYVYVRNDLFNKK